MREKLSGTAGGNISSVDKAFAVIDYLYEAGGEASLNEISKGLSMNKSTAYRILNAVKAAGYIFQNEENANYSLSARFYQIGLLLQNSPRFLFAYAPYARALNEKYNEVITVATRELAVCDIPRAMEVYGFHDNHSLTMRITMGSYTEAHCTASGKCLLAFSKENYLNRFVGCPLKEHTPYTITGWDQLSLELQRIRECGYAIDREEYELGLNGIATPLFAPNGNVVGALSFTLPSERFRRLDLAPVIADMRAVTDLRLDV